MKKAKRYTRMLETEACPGAQFTDQDREEFNKDFGQDPQERISNVADYQRVFGCDPREPVKSYLENTVVAVLLGLGTGTAEWVDEWRDIVKQGVDKDLTELAQKLHADMAQALGIKTDADS